MHSILCLDPEGNKELYYYILFFVLTLQNWDAWGNAQTVLYVGDIRPFGFKNNNLRVEKCELGSV